MKVIKIHRSGLMYCVVSIVISLLAIYGGNNFHYLVASVILGYFVSSGIAGYRNIRGVEASFSFPDEIYARSPFLIKVNVRCKMRAPAFLIDVKVGESRVFFPVIQPGETESKTLFFELPSRGICEINDIELSSSYPFDFFTRYWPVSFDRRVTVFPAPIPDRSSYSGNWTGPGENAEKKQKLDADLDTIGVRPYVEGDAMKTIHWKSSARTGRLNSRLYDDSRDSEAKIIDLDILISKGKETGLSIASYEISRAIKSGLPIGVKDRGAVWAPSKSRADKLSMLAALAVYD